MIRVGSGSSTTWLFMSRGISGQLAGYPLHNEDD